MISNINHVLISKIVKFMRDEIIKDKNLNCRSGGIFLNTGFSSSRCITTSCPSYVMMKIKESLVATVFIKQQIKSELKIWMRGGNAQYGRLQTLPNGLKEINQRRFKKEKMERDKDSHSGSIYIYI